MVDLTEYGFTKTKEDERWDEYEGHSLIITIYHYPFATSFGEAMRNSFLVSSAKTTSPSFPVLELESWLTKHNIKKTS